MLNSSILKNEKLFCALFCAFEICVFIPYLQWQLNKIIIAVIFLAIFLTMFSMGLFDLRNASYISLVAIIQTLQIVIYWILGISTCSLNKAINHIIIIWLFLALMKTREISLRSKRFISYTALIIIIINIADNIRLNIIYPNASEYINFSWGTQFYSMNVGNSVFIALVSFFTLFSVYKTLKSNLILNKIGWVILIAIGTSYIVITGRGICFLTLLIGAILIIYLQLWSRISKNQKIIFLMISILVFAFMILVIFPKLLYSLSELVDERLGARIREVAAMLNFWGTESTDEMISSSGDSRIGLYKMSLETWLSNPFNFIFGIGEHPAYVDSLNKIGIGAHSAILDNFAEYGLIGGCSLLILLKESFNILYRKMDGCLRVIFILYFINALMNNVIEMNCLVLILGIIPNFPSIYRCDDRIDETDYTIV